MILKKIEPEIQLLNKKCNKNNKFAKWCYTFKTT